MAESELGILAAQCLDRRSPEKSKLIEDVAAWQDNRDKHHEGRLAIHNRKRPREAKKAIPSA